MLAELETLATRLDTLPLAVRQELVFQVNHFAAFLLSFNQDYLQREGKRPDGQTISPGGYTSAYAAFRRKYGKQVGYVDLTFTRDYIDAYVLEYLGGLRFEVDNTDPKAPLLQARYGELKGIREADVLDFVSVIVEPEIKAFVGRYMQL